VALCCAGKLLSGNIGSLCEQQPLKALRAPCGPIPQYHIIEARLSTWLARAKPSHRPIFLGEKMAL
jgi:hypothetical protein